MTWTDAAALIGGVCFSLALALAIASLTYAWFAFRD